MNSKHLLLSALAFCLTTAAFSQKELKPKQLNIFKNGTYFVVKEGTVTPKNGIWMMEMKQNPLLATFWLTTTKDAEINRIDYKMDTIKTNRKAVSYIDLINANQGKTVSLTYMQGNNNENLQTISGTIEKFYTNTNMLKFKVGTDFKFFSATSVIDMTFKENPKDDLKYDSMARVAKVTFGKSKDNTPLKLTYMQTGISWIPSYNIKIVDDKTLQLEMKALIENYSGENMNDVDLTLTVGAANFKYGTQTDPLANMYYTGASAGNYAYNNYNYNGYNNYNAYQTYSNTLSSGYADESTYGGTPAYNNYQTYSTEGDKTNDLYMYKLGKVSLTMNTKSQFSIFSSNVSYEEVYEVDLYDQINYASTYQITNREEQVNPVFHSLKINNSTTNPFTTAPVFVQDKNLQPLAQDQIKYTPVGSKVKVQLAQSPDVKVKNTEEEITSVEKAKKYNNYYYKKVTIKGEIKVENLQPKSAKINVMKHINGDITEASDSGETKKTGQYTGVNPQSNTEWNVTVGANEKKTLTYSYDVYIYQAY
jgi:hypothetical protein